MFLLLLLLCDKHEIEVKVDVSIFFSWRPRPKLLSLSHQISCLIKKVFWGVGILKLINAFLLGSLKLFFRGRTFGVFATASPKLSEIL